MQSNFMTYSNSAIFDFVVKVHAEDQLASVPLVVTQYQIDESGFLTLKFSHPIAKPEAYDSSEEDLEDELEAYKV